MFGHKNADEAESSIQRASIENPSGDSTHVINKSSFTNLTQYVLGQDWEKYSRRNLVWIHYATKNGKAFGKFYNNGLSHKVT